MPFFFWYFNKNSVIMESRWFKELLDPMEMLRRRNLGSWCQLSGNPGPLGRSYSSGVRVGVSIGRSSCCNSLIIISTGLS